MKMDSAIYVWGLTAVFIFAAGCISIGNDNNPGATLQSPAATSMAGSPQAVSPALTDAQKTQAASIAKSDPSMSALLGKPGYTITGVFSEGPGANNDVNAAVFIEGESTVHADGSIWTPDIYQVSVDITANRVAGVKHIEPKVLPTPTSAPKN
ncbi:hypothetical protein [Methanocella sp.]|uniref:hypothetical protein n=1 Tax=Methanocella sp. TaxID=2052833 RepID=UPI002D80B4C9|nr:hypothetical protein [Methanocella sp.]